MSNGTILLIEPTDAEGDLALRVSYGHVTEGYDKGDLVKDHEVLDTVTLFGPKGIPLEVHICKNTGIGPIFVGEHVVFGPIFITSARWEPLHCDNCGRIIVSWFANMQHDWKERYHGKDWSTNSEGDCQKPKRLN